MAETVKLTRAEVTTFSRTDKNALREFKTDKGGIIFSFRVQTRVNDKVDNSPRLFRKCSYFAKTDEQAQNARKLITKGAILELEGVTNRKSFEDKTTKQKVYYDEISVNNLIAIQVGANHQEDAEREDLPF